MKASAIPPVIQCDLQPAELANVHERIGVAAVELTAAQRIEEIGERVGGPPGWARSGRSRPRGANRSHHSVCDDRRGLVQQDVGDERPTLKLMQPLQ